ncbi:MAG: hypothetical protein PHS95_02440 [Candidatus Pacebacteria bacterium]|nr:hypothetical protein [Candidatus Paceibacterota bacterium]
MKETLNQTVSGFIKGFETKFSDYLIPVGSFKDAFINPITTSYFAVCPPRDGKFSDWDLHCCVNFQNITFPVLVLMDNFIKTFSGFIYTKSFRHSGQPQFMSFMFNENFAPFIDIHIDGVPGEIVRNYILGIDATELKEGTEDWSHITLWRKAKNTGLPFNHDEVLGEYLQSKGYPKIVEFFRH